MSDPASVVESAERLMMSACEDIHIRAEAAHLTVEETARALTDSGYAGLAVEYRAWAEVWVA